MATVRLRTGKHPPTGFKRPSTPGKLAPEGPATPKRPKSKGKYGLPVVQETGRRLIKQSGGSKSDVKTWRKLPMGQRQRIKSRVAARGGSLTAAVRKIGTLKGR